MKKIRKCNNCKERYTDLHPVMCNTCVQKMLEKRFIEALNDPKELENTKKPFQKRDLTYLRDIGYTLNKLKIRDGWVYDRRDIIEIAMLYTNLKIKKSYDIESDNIEEGYALIINELHRYYIKTLLMM